MDGVFYGKGINALKKNNKELYTSICRLDESVWDEGPLSRKDKKLIAIAITASKLNKSGFEKQVRSSKIKLGISREEVMDVLKVVLLTSGMPAFNMGLEILNKIYD